MTPDDFRRLALALEGAEERAHMGHPDFRVAGRIFATLAHPDKAWGMVKLTPEQQNDIVRAEPAIFMPVNGAWGRKGCTSVSLAAATADVLAPVLGIAWENARAYKPKRAASQRKPPAKRAAAGRRRSGGG
jgi:hypothetical protein